MPRQSPDALAEVSRVAGGYYAGLDRLLPGPGGLPDGCSGPLVADGPAGRLAGFAVCTHQVIPAGSLDQSFGAAARFVLAIRLRGPGTPAVDLLLTRWREHLLGLPGAAAADTAAVIDWPSREASGVQALLWHGMQPVGVLAARPRGRGTAAGAATGIVIRDAGPGDAGAVTAMTMRVIEHDAQFGVTVPRPATGDLVRGQVQAALQRHPSWIWLAERDRRPSGLVSVQPPREAAWIAGTTGAAPVAYLSAGYVVPAERGAGVAAALVRRAHDFLDAQGIAVTLLHYALVNPRSGPFWARMGYRPLWVNWQARPAAALR